MAELFSDRRRCPFESLRQVRQHRHAALVHAIDGDAEIAVVRPGHIELEIRHLGVPAADGHHDSAPPGRCGKASPPGCAWSCAGSSGCMLQLFLQHGDLLGLLVVAGTSSISAAMSSVPASAATTGDHRRLAGRTDIGFSAQGSGWPDASIRRRPMWMRSAMPSLVRVSGCSRQKRSKSWAPFERQTCRRGSVR